MNKRKDIQAFIISLEQKYNVNQILYKGISLWPLIRIRLFFFLVFKLENHSTANGKTESWAIRIWHLLESIGLTLRLLLSPKRITTLYAGSHLHRVMYRGVSFNRFFDVLMDEAGNENDCLLVEYHNPGKKLNYYKHFRVLQLFKLYPLFFHLARLRTEEKMEANVLVFIKSMKTEIESAFPIEFNDSKFLAGLQQELKTIFVYRDIFNVFLKKWRVKETVGLCYYNTPIFGLTIAAAELGIPSVDYQHGPQNLSYRDWSNVPEEGYTLIPAHFYCWNEIDALAINEWAHRTRRHQAFFHGNSWVRFWQTGKAEISSGVDWQKNIILYTLQPVEGCFEPYLLETIKATAGNFSWWIRLHPRQFHEKDKILRELSEAGVASFTNIENASELPLPEILMHTKLHITKFSGSVLEATEFNIPSIIIDQKGKDHFGPFIDERFYRVVLDKNKDSMLNAIRDLVKN